MFIKNKSNKVIGFGQEVVLPGQEIEIADSFSKNPVVAAYENLGFVEVIRKEETPSTPKKSKKAE